MHHTYKNTLLVTLKRRPKREKRSKAEGAMESTMTSLMKYQMKAAEECWKREQELEEKQRREDQQHELRVLQMLGQR